MGDAAARMAHARQARAMEALLHRAEDLISCIPTMLPDAGPKFMRIDHQVRLPCGTVVQLVASVEVME